MKWLLHAICAESRDLEERLHQAIDAAAADRDLLIKVARQENSGLSRAKLFQIALGQLRGLVPTPSDESPFAGSKPPKLTVKTCMNQKRRRRSVPMLRTHCQSWLHRFRI